MLINGDEMCASCVYVCAYLRCCVRVHGCGISMNSESSGIGMSNRLNDDAEYFRQKQMQDEMVSLMSKVAT